MAAENLKISVVTVGDQRQGVILVEMSILFKRRRHFSVGDSVSPGRLRRFKMCVAAVAASGQRNEGKSEPSA